MTGPSPCRRFLSHTRMYTVLMCARTLSHLHLRYVACRSLDLAFQDLNALMAMAADMVKLAEKFRGVMSQVGGLHRGRQPGHS